MRKTPQPMTPSRLPMPRRLTRTRKSAVPCMKKVSAIDAAIRTLEAEKVRPKRCP